MNVLVACEFSQVVCAAFRERGHEAYSCDLLPTDGNPKWHLQGDCFGAITEGHPYTREPWHCLIHHAPCTFILNSGCKWLYKGGKRFIKDKNGNVIGENPREEYRWCEMVKGAEFFKRLQGQNVPLVCGENPIMVGYAVDIIGQDYTQMIHPYEYGHTEQKSTCLWLKNLPPLVPTNNVKAEMMKLPKAERERVHYASPGENRWRERSRTFQGIAEAMAEQWGNVSPVGGPLLFTSDQKQALEVTA